MIVLGQVKAMGGAVVLPRHPLMASHVTYGHEDDVGACAAAWSRKHHAASGDSVCISSRDRGEAMRGRRCLSTPLTLPLLIVLVLELQIPR